LAEVLGTGRIDLPQHHEQSGNPVDVTMEFDSQGRLHARAVDVRTGSQIVMTVDVPGGLRHEEVVVYRQFMEQSGFRAPFQVGEALDRLTAEDDDDDELPMIKPI
jgi:hypothetical protein